VLHVLSILFALVAVVCMVVAIAWMVTGRPGARAGVLIRVAALACFVIAVVLNVVAH
jgi:hypothetical protein